MVIVYEEDASARDVAVILLKCIFEFATLFKFEQIRRGVLFAGVRLMDK